MSQAMGGFNLPPPPKLTRNLLIGLFALYTVELLLRNGASVDLGPLVWHDFSHGFQPWQLITRFFVQGQSVYSVILTGVGIYFFLPTIERSFTRRQLIQAMSIAVGGGTAFGLALAAIGLVHGTAFGITPLVAALVVLFGLAHPNATINLMLIFPVPAKVLVWGAGVLSFLLLLASFDLRAAVAFGTWLGAIGWWYWLGPSGRKRRLKTKASKIRTELRLIQGGQSDPNVH